jgi:hypothetical protein
MYKKIKELCVVPRGEIFLAQKFNDKWIVIIEGKERDEYNDVAER